MKTLTIILTLIAATCYGQDSTDIKLLKYKGMYEQGLIDSAEYKALRSKLLGVSQTAPVQQTPTVVTIVKQTNPVARYKSKTITGGIFLAVGMGLLVADFGYIIGTNRLKQDPPANRKEVIIGLSTGSGVCILIGAILVGVGQHEKAVHESKKTALNIKANQNSIGLALNF